jgi:hypothetical protein
MVIALRPLKEKAIQLHKEEGLRPFEILRREEFANMTTLATIAGWIRKAGGGRGKNVPQALRPEVIRLHREEGLSAYKISRMEKFKGVVPRRVIYRWTREEEPRTQQRTS